MLLFRVVVFAVVCGCVEMGEVEESVVFDVEVDEDFMVVSLEVSSGKVT